MKKAERDAIRERCEKATPGPWRSTYFDCVERNGLALTVGTKEQPIMSAWHRRDDEGKEQAIANQKFIAHSRQDIPALLDALDEMGTLAET